MKKYLTKLLEDVYFKDLMQNKGLSNFTKKYKKETDSLMGSASKHSKLVQAKINKEKDFITFIFLTERTPKYKDNFNLQSVTSSNFKLHSDNLYTVEIRLLHVFEQLKNIPSEKINNKTIEDLLFNSQIQIWSDNPSFQYQGMNYNMTQLDGSIHPENRSPKHWNNYHHGEQFLDKHSQGIINSIKFYIPQMRQILKKYLGMTKK
jgi:hypothetical protein